MTTSVATISGSWSLVVASTVTKFTLQVRSGEVEVYFANTLPADTEAGFHLVKGQGVNRNYGDGNVYVKDIVPEIASKVVVDIS